jgi:hypothetical protein
VSNGTIPPKNNDVIRELFAVLLISIGVIGGLVSCGMIWGWPGMGLIVSPVVVWIGYRLGVSPTGKE